MVWFKVDDNLAFHAKSVAAGNPAMGLWVRAGSWAAQQVTDGFIPDHIVSVLGTTAQAKTLVKVNLWEQELGGYRFHAWTERQPSKADVEAERAAARDRMRAARAKKKGVKQDPSPQVSALRSAEHDPKFGGSSEEVRDVFALPDPTRPDPTHKTSTSAVAVEEQRPEVIALCERLAKAVAANGSAKPSITKAWLDAARLLLDKDGRTVQQVEWIIDWSQDDEFWRANILSMPTLRKQFDKLRLKAVPETAAKPKHDPEWALR